MDYKKKYFDAIERLKQWDREHPNDVVSERDKFVFPELAEPDGERIRRSLIDYFGRFDARNEFDENIEFGKVVAWLEKQGEQKPVEYSLEQVAMIFLDALAKTPYNNKPITDAQVITKELLKFLEDASSYNPDALVEQKPKWSEKKRKEFIGELQSLMLEWSNKQSNMGVCINRHIEKLLSIASNISDSKQEWCEEDESMISNFQSELSNLVARKLIKESTYQKYSDWLKSLRPRKQWKPSEEQLYALKSALDPYPTLRPREFHNLKELLEQLKTL